MIEYTGTEFKNFLNYPFGDSIILKNKKEYYYELKSKCRQVALKDCDNCFKNRVLQNHYNKLIEEYRGKIPSNYNYIFKYGFLKDLIRNYPKLKYIANALSYKEFGKLEVAEIEFAHKLSHLIEFYGYGSIGSFHWNCGHIYALSHKENTEFVFCENADD